MKLLRRIMSGIAHRYATWTFRPYTITRCFGETSFSFLIGDLFGKRAYGPHHTEWPELDWIRKHGIEDGDIVVDCGANHGFSTILFAKWTGEHGEVHAFEPSAHNISILKENLRINSVENVVCHQAAAGSQPGSVQVSLHPNASVQDPADATKKKNQQVALVTLDEALHERTIDFIKIDVEGYELEVLKGARLLLATRPKFDVELHVCLYRDKSLELEKIFSLLPLRQGSTYIQTEVDGPITKYQIDHHSPEHLSKFDLVHVFCG